MNYIGCSGWFYPHWHGSFYPSELKQSRWFKYYSEKFNTVELNSTFYHFPKESTARNWHRSSPKGFVYTLKVNRIITHLKRFVGTKRLINDFYRIGERLEEKMGCFLFQLPPSLHFTEKKLHEILSQLDPEKRNVLEFRHQSWFNDDVYRELKKNGIIFCSVSAPKLPDDLIKTGKDIYIRFHGRDRWYSHNYSDEELESWAERILKSRAVNVWCYFNNDFNAYAPKNAMKLREFLST
ncbi:MAG: DUF72 domain-containing protein [Candidatus Aenigmatarchaeota archaeon]|nr:MAG: DUF72 domain-containing protein [Candidatus Aenigmarchaeota archaeon]